MSSRLECKNLTKDYGNVMALSDVNLTLESGRIVGLLRTEWKRKDHIDQTGKWSASAHIRRNFVKRFETRAGDKSIRFLSAGCKLSAGLDECGSTGRNV